MKIKIILLCSLVLTAGCSTLNESKTDRLPSDTADCVDIVSNIIRPKKISPINLDSLTLQKLSMEGFLENSEVIYKDVADRNDTSIWDFTVTDKGIFVTTNNVRLLKDGQLRDIEPNAHVFWNSRSSWDNHLETVHKFETFPS